MEVPSLKEGKPLTTQVVRGGITGLIQNKRSKKKPAFAVDITLENYSLFVDRMHEEGIPMKVRKSGKKI